MNAPQIIWIVLAALGIGIHMAKHGQPEQGTYCFFTQSICVAFTAGLLYWGGFFG